MAPSTSQNGKLSSEHTPSTHERGFFLVHAESSTTTTKSIASAHVRPSCPRLSANHRGGCVTNLARKYLLIGCRILRRHPFHRLRAERSARCFGALRACCVGLGNRRRRRGRDACWMRGHANSSWLCRARGRVWWSECDGGWRCCG